MATSTSKLLRWVGGVLLALVLVAVAAGLAAVFFVDWNALKPHVEQAATKALDRRVQIGSLSIDWGATSLIRMQDVRVANPDWVARDPFAAADEVRIGLRIWPLLRGQVNLSEVLVTQPKVDLVRDAEGRANWHFGEGTETMGEIAAPETREEFPAVGRLRIQDGSLRYDDALRGTALEGDISTAAGDAKGEDRIELNAKGSLQEQAFSIAFAGGSLSLLRDTERPFPVDLAIAFGDTRLQARGSVIAPLEFRGMDLEVDIEGPSLAQIFPLLGIPLPESPPYKLTGSVGREAETWRFANLDGKVGNSDISGDVLVDRSRDPPFLKADLVSQRLDSADFAGFLGTDRAAEDAPEAAAAEGADDNGLFPKVPIAHERLKAMDMDITFKGKSVMAEWVPVDDLEARIQLNDSRVLVKPLRLSVAKGDVAGELAFNARSETPSADADLRFDALDLKPFFEETEFVQETGGRFSGHVYLLGEGESLDAILAGSTGNGWIAMGDGTISALLVEAAGLDVAEALALYLDEDVRAKIRCGRVDVEAAAGRLNATRAIIDTSDSILLARGWVDLGRESLDIQIEARPKDFSLIDLAAPVSVSGPISDPAISIGGLDPLPFLELGQASDLNCARLITGEISAAEAEEED